MVKIGDKDPSSEIVNLPPVGSVEETSLTSTKGVGVQSLDKLSTSEQTEKAPPVANADQPTISQPDSKQLTEAKMNNAINFLQNNPWFAPSFLACFTAVLMELLNTEKTIHYNEAKTELLVRSKILEMAKTSASLAKLLQDNQAKEQMVQAITAFANAAVAAVQFAQTCRSMNSVRETVDKRITAQQEKVDKLELKKDGIIVADDYDKTRFKAQLDAAKSKPDDPNLHKELIDAKKGLKDLQDNKETNIYREMQNHDQQVQQLGQVMTQTMNGVAAILQANIKSDTGRKEELMKLTDGFREAFNKFSETTSKQRDDAKANFDRFAEFLMRITEAVYRAHQLKG